MNRPTMPKYLTTEEVAELLRTSPETVRFWRHVGKGPKSFKLGRRVLYDVDDVEAPPARRHHQAREAMTPAGVAVLIFQPCQPCKDAHNVARRERKAKQRAEGDAA